MQTIALVVLVALFVATALTYLRYDAAVRYESYNLLFIFRLLTSWPLFLVWWPRPALEEAVRYFVTTFAAVLVLLSPIWWYYRSDGRLVLSLLWLGVSMYGFSRAADHKSQYQNFYIGMIALLGASGAIFLTLWIFRSVGMLVIPYCWYALAAGLILWRRAVKPWLEIVDDYAMRRRAEWSID